MVKQFTLTEIRNLHKSEPNVLFSYFMDNYCKNYLEQNDGLKKVEVIVSERSKFEYIKTKLEIVK